MSNVSRGLKVFFVLSLVGAMLITAISGLISMEKAPPYPAKTVSNQGETIFTKDVILKGQSAFQEYGLMDLGSVWGHGTYRGADFTAETLHLAGVPLREFYANDKFKKNYQSLNQEEKAVADQLAIKDIKTNQYDAAKDTLFPTLKSSLSSRSGLITITFLIRAKRKK